MKNVLVLYSHNLSASYLKDMRLADASSMGPNYDSSEFIRTLLDPETDNFDKQQAETDLSALQTADGIQFHHIKNRYPRPDASTPKTEDFIEPAIEQMRTFLASRGEKLDAIVVPRGYRADEPATFRWLREMRQQFPGVKILVENNQIPYNADKGAVERETYVLPQSKKFQNNGFREAIITSDTSGYTLNSDVVDRVTVNLDGIRRANALRSLVGMEPLQALKRGRAD